MHLATPSTHPSNDDLKPSHKVHPIFHILDRQLPLSLEDEEPLDPVEVTDLRAFRTLCG